MLIPKNLTAEQFRDYFKSNYKDLTLLDDYNTGSEKVSVQCVIDDHT